MIGSTKLKFHSFNYISVKSKTLKKHVKILFKEIVQESNIQEIIINLSVNANNYVKITF